MERVPWRTRATGKQSLAMNTEENNNTAYQTQQIIEQLKLWISLPIFALYMNIHII